MHDDDAVVIVKKPKKDHGGAHGGAWKVAYADFVTAMMAFFLVMWILGLSDESKEAIAAYFSDPSGFAEKFGKGSALSTASNPARSNAVLPGVGDTILAGFTKSEQRAILEEAKENMTASLKKDPDFKDLRGFVEISIAEGGLRIELVEGGDAIFFESGKWDLKPAARRLLHVISRSLLEVPNPISIEGHTDAHPVRPSAGYTNWELSTERANAARRALCEVGLPERRVIAVQGYADRNPRVPLDPFHYSNRRVSILVHYMDDPAKWIQREHIQHGLDESDDAFDTRSSPTGRD
jgi:chemotaxis protein MotB